MPRVHMSECSPARGGEDKELSLPPRQKVVMRARTVALARDLVTRQDGLGCVVSALGAKSSSERRRCCSPAASVQVFGKARLYNWLCSLRCGVMFAFLLVYRRMVMGCPRVISVQLEKRKERAVCMLLCMHPLLLPSAAGPACLVSQNAGAHTGARVPRTTEPSRGGFQLCQGAVASKVN